MKTFCCLLILAVVSLCQAQRVIRPPGRVRIPWTYAGAESLTALWRGFPRCATYNVQLLESHTNVVLETFNGITNTNFTFTGLDRDKVYGARAQCVAASGATSNYGRPGRSKTIGTTTTTTPATPTGTPKTGSCGTDSFTCEDTSCIPIGDWCNKIKDCPDGTDEFACPGHCEELTEFHPHGNFSCSLFNSPSSACFFQCDDDFSRNGPLYTVCKDSEWTREVPYCTLDAPSLILESVSRTSFRVLFTALNGASEYRIASLTRGQEEVAVDEFVYNEDSGIVESVISGLSRGRYSIAIAGVDSTGTVGETSTPSTITI